VRLTIGRWTTADDVETAAAAIAEPPAGWVITAGRDTMTRVWPRGR